MPMEQFVVFTVAKEEYAVSISQVKEIIVYEGTTRLPNTPNYLKGVINLRGKVIPIVDLTVRFNLDSEENKNSRAIILEVASREIGILVDEVTEVIRVDDSSIEPTPAIANRNDYLRGIAKFGSRLIIIMDINRLFNEEEITLLKEAG